MVGLIFYSAVFGDTIYPNGTDSFGCQPSDREGANRGHLVWHGSYNYSETAYNEAVNGVMPVITVVWGKNDTDGERWTDARFVCMRPREVNAGRIPDGFPLPVGPNDTTPLDNPALGTGRKMHGYGIVPSVVLAVVVGVACFLW